MKTKQLKLEINNLLGAVEKCCGKKSISYQNIDYLLDIIFTVYVDNHDSEKDLLGELKEVLLKLSKEIPELKPEQFNETYPNINEMIKYLDQNLTD